MHFVCVLRSCELDVEILKGSDRKILLEIRIAIVCVVIIPLSIYIHVTRANVTPIHLHHTPKLKSRRI